VTILEQIAQKMNWDVMPENRIWQFRDKDRRTFSLHHWECCKALQAKMVQDGIQFVFAQDDEHETSATAFVLNHDGTNGTWDEIVVQLETHNPEDEPAAIVELFCKVYHIDCRDGRRDKNWVEAK
jgi:hypothetical protein